MKDEDVRKSAIIAQYDEVKHQQQSEKPIPYGTYEHLHSAIFNQTKPNSVKNILLQNASSLLQLLSS